jgi:gliding motility-associated-like protein
VVTPNGDGKNDVWRVETQNRKDMHVDIFNRWGNQVAQLEGIADKWNPEDASAGTYYFQITALGLDGEAYNHEGHFTVLKTEN